MTLVTAGRVGKPHGLDGSFYVDGPRHALPEGARMVVGSVSRTIERRAGTDERPLIRLSGVDDPAALRGEIILVEDELAAGEWLAADLAGCAVVGLGPVTRVLDGPVLQPARAGGRHTGPAGVRRDREHRRRCA